MNALISTCCIFAGAAMLVVGYDLGSTNPATAVQNFGDSLLITSLLAFGAALALVGFAGLFLQMA